MPRSLSRGDAETTKIEIQDFFLFRFEGREESSGGKDWVSGGAILKIVIEVTLAQEQSRLRLKQKVNEWRLKRVEI